MRSHSAFSCGRIVHLVELQPLSDHCMRPHAFPTMRPHSWLFGSLFPPCLFGSFSMSSVALWLPPPTRKLVFDVLTPTCRAPLLEQVFVCLLLIIRRLDPSLGLFPMFAQFSWIRCASRITSPGDKCPSTKKGYHPNL